MNRTEIENQLLYEFRGLSLQKLEETLNFVLFLKHPKNLQKLNQYTKLKKLNPLNRPVGLLDGKAKCLMHEDFKITDKEFLQS